MRKCKLNDFKENGMTSGDNANERILQERICPNLDSIRKDWKLSNSYNS